MFRSKTSMPSTPRVQNTSCSPHAAEKEAHSDDGASSSGAGQSVDSDFYFTFVVFEVEGTLHRVPSNIFVRDSDYFATLLKPLGDALDQKEANLSAPVVLPNIRQSDFHNFLKAVYPTTIAARRVLSQEEWLSTLKLATKWHFKSLRAVAISELESARFETLTALQKVTFGRDYFISSWLRSGLCEYVDRQETLDNYEAFCISSSTAFELFRMRELRISRPLTYNAVKDVVCKFRTELLSLNTKAEEQGFKLCPEARDVLLTPDPLSSTMASPTKKRKMV